MQQSSFQAPDLLRIVDIHRYTHEYERDHDERAERRQRPRRLLEAGGVRWPTERCWVARGSGEDSPERWR